MITDEAIFLQLQDDMEIVKTKLILIRRNMYWIALAMVINAVSLFVCMTILLKR